MLAELGPASAVRGAAIALGLAIIGTMTLLVAVRRRRPPSRASLGVTVLFLLSYYGLVTAGVWEFVRRYGVHELSPTTVLGVLAMVLGMASLGLAVFEPGALQWDGKERRRRDRRRPR